MQVEPNKDNSFKVFLEVPEYKAIVETAPSMTTILIRLMAHSLRVGTVVRVRKGDFYYDDEAGIWLLTVGAKNTEDSDEWKYRDVRISDDLMETIEKQFGNLDNDELLFKYSKRTAQRRVEEIAEKTAVAQGNEDFEKVSAHDFRRYFATHMIFRCDLKPKVVMQLGGWKDYQSMLDYLVLPNDVLARHLDEANLLSAPMDTIQPTSAKEQLQQAVDNLEKRVKDTQDEQVLAHAAREVQQIFEPYRGIKVVISDGEEPEVKSTGEQLSLNDISDIDEAVDGYTEHKSQINFGTAVAQPLKNRLKVEHRYLRASPDVAWPLPKRQLATMLLTLTGWAIFVGTFVATSGLAEPVITGDTLATVGLLGGLCSYLVYLVYDVTQRYNYSPGQMTHR